MNAPLLDRIQGACPVCSTKFNQRSHKSLCSHVVWSRKAGTFVLARPKKTEDVQEQKYAKNWRWRRPR